MLDWTWNAMMGIVAVGAIIALIVAASFLRR
jgi:hypothetical protein